MRADALNTKVRRQYIPSIHKSGKLLKLDDAPELLLLDPKRSYVEMTHSSDAASLDYA